MRLRLLLIPALVLAAAAAVVAGAVTTPVMFTIAGAGKRAGFTGDGGPATAATLNGPSALAAAPDGSIYVADEINQRIRRIDPKGRISTIAGTGKRGFGGDGGPATAATLQDPGALALAPDGSLYVADTHNSRLRVIRPDGTIATVAGTDDQGFSGDGGPAVRAQLREPGGVVVASNGTVFFSDTADNRIRRIAADGTIATVAGTGAAGFSGDGGAATSAQLNAPAGLALQADGTLLVADSGNNRVRRIAPNGLITTLAGTGTAGSGGDGGAAREAQLNGPSDVAADASGVYIAEAGGNRVRVVSPSGTIFRLAGAGGPRYGGDGGVPTKALLNAPRSVEIVSGGTAIADTDNNRVRYVATPGAGTILALAPKADSVRAPLRKVRRSAGGRTFRVLVVADVGLRYVVTQPASLKAVLLGKKGKRKVATVRGRARAGANALHLPGRLRSGAHRLVKDHYVVRMTVTADGQTATRSFELVVK
jgi:sugar lactone lactonase YvrE